MCYLDPRIDFVFKKLFGSEENKDILLALINSMLDTEQQIVSLEIKNPYNFAQFKDDKISILDIKAQDEQKRWYDIEMQFDNKGFSTARNLFYWAEMYAAQMRSGGRYSELNKVICINIVNFNHLHEEHYHNVYRLFNKNTHNQIDRDLLELHFIELEKAPQALSYQM